MIRRIIELFHPSVETRARRAVKEARHELFTVQVQIVRLEAHAEACKRIINDHGVRAGAVQSLREQRHG